MKATETTASAGLVLHVSYSDRPSRAWLRGDTQCVLIKSLWGAVRSTDIELVKVILADAIRLETHINLHCSDASTRHDLKVRSILFDVVHKSMVISVELLHGRQVTAALTEVQLCEAFYHAQSHYGGHFGMVVVTVTPVELAPGHYDPLADSFYESVRAVIDW